VTDRSIKKFEIKLKIKLAKIGFNPKWLESGQFVESMSSRELTTFNDMADEILKRRKEKKNDR
tara:strand:+ start:275 stop:463 length:189 start_codon:yes stop_codon:yes gene_type:complete